MARLSTRRSPLMQWMSAPYRLTLEELEMKDILILQIVIILKIMDKANMNIILMLSGKAKAKGAKVAICNATDAGALGTWPKIVLPQKDANPTTHAMNVVAKGTMQRTILAAAARVTVFREVPIAPKEAQEKEEDGIKEDGTKEDGIKEDGTQKEKDSKDGKEEAKAREKEVGLAKVDGERVTQDL